MDSLFFVWIDYSLLVSSQYLHIRLKSHIKLAYYKVKI